MLIKHLPPLLSPKGIFVSAILSDDTEEFISEGNIFFVQGKVELQSCNQGTFWVWIFKEMERIYTLK